jgi:uncharacterized protein (UPF0303 family)
MDIATTGGFTSAQLAEQSHQLQLDFFDARHALLLGEIALSLAQQRELPVAIEIWVSGRLMFKAALPGTSEENDDWLRRKRNVTEKFDDSTMAVRVRHEEQALEFNVVTELPIEDYAAHGGGWPIKVNNSGTVGFLGISGLPQVEDHKLIVECMEILQEMINTD